MILGMNHITINVKNTEGSKQFYSDVLGLKLLEVVDMGDLEISYYGVPGECRIELIDYATNEPIAHVEQKALGCYRHMAMTVDHLDSYYNECIKRGIPILMEPCTMEKLHCKGMLIEDPNGVEVELVERLTV